ncbi:MAG: hypothetical protein ACT4TC_10955 [Myxococcaceae bacterium]
MQRCLSGTALGLLLLSGCVASAPIDFQDAVIAPDGTPLPAGGTPEHPREVPVHIVFIHGVQSENSGKLTAEGSLAPLEEELKRKLAERRAHYEATYPFMRLRFETYRVNLYTLLTGVLPPTTIDDPQDGTGVPAAAAWRAALSESLAKLLPPDARNIILVGHSTGGRVAVELAANVGGAGEVGAQDYGWQDRIAGVVTVNGMINRLGQGTYNFIGPISFERGCPVGQANGWCDYAANISGVPAADWVAANRHILMMMSAGDCSPALWTGETDQALPLQAQGSPLAPGMSMTPIAGDTFAPAHGNHYGAYCHSDISNFGSPRHLGAREAVSNAMVRWIFDSAPRVVGPASPVFQTDALSTDQLSATYESGGECGANEREAALQVVGTCVHQPDGADHILDANANVLVSSVSPCRGAVRWVQKEPGVRPARLWIKLTAEPLGGGLLATVR